MELLSNAQREIEELPDPGITLSDDCRLSARVWRPVEAVNDPVSLPLSHQSRDMQGIGDAQGPIPDGYPVEEQARAMEMIDWLARPPWCRAPVALTGPPLPAIRTVQSTVDLRADGLSSRGGHPENAPAGWRAPIWSCPRRAAHPVLARKARPGIGAKPPKSAPPLPSADLRFPRRDSHWSPRSPFARTVRCALPPRTAAGRRPINPFADNRIPSHREVAGSRPREGL